MFRMSIISIVLAGAGCTEAAAPDPLVAEPEAPTQAAADGFAASSDALPVVAREGIHEIGAFRIEIRPDAGLDVHHSSAPSRSLFTSAKGAPWTTARADLAAIDHQGSVSPRCSTGRAPRSARGSSPT